MTPLKSTASLHISQQLQLSTEEVLLDKFVLQESILLKRRRKFRSFDAGCKRLVIRTHLIPRSLRNTKRSRF